MRRGGTRVVSLLNNTGEVYGQTRKTHASPNHRRTTMKRLALAACLALAAVPAHAATSVTFVTEGKAQAEQGCFYEALAEGLYAKRGLDVHIVQGGPSVNVPQLLAGGAADFGIGSNDFIAL